MKQITILIACFLSTKTFAQVLKLDMDKVKKYLDQSKGQKGISPTKPQKLLSPLLIKKSMFDTVRFSHTTAQGDVFVLPQDNMPCLKPNSNIYVNNMPNAITQSSTNEQNAAAQIPNAYQGRPLILVIPQKINPPSTGK